MVNNVHRILPVAKAQANSKIIIGGLILVFIIIMIQTLVSSFINSNK